MTARDSVARTGIDTRSATTAARNGTPIDRLQDAGGWSSPAIPLAYVEAAAIATVLNGLQRKGS